MNCVRCKWFVFGLNAVCVRVSMYFLYASACILHPPIRQRKFIRIYGWTEICMQCRHCPTPTPFRTLLFTTTLTCIRSRFYCCCCCSCFSISHIVLSTFAVLLCMISYFRHINYIRIINSSFSCIIRCKQSNQVKIARQKHLNGHKNAEKPVRHFGGTMYISSS